MGTRTSFYGFTAFSIVQSILTLRGRGFQHVPLGKVRRQEWAWPHGPWMRESRRRGVDTLCVSGVWIIKSSVHMREEQ